VTEQVKLPQRRRTLLRRATAWVEQWQARPRSPALDATFETIERDSDIGGAMLAGALSYRLFVVALPLAFLLVSAAGLLADALSIDEKSLPKSVGLTNAIAKQVASAGGSSNWWVALTSLVALAYATRVLFRAIAIVHALAWEHSAAAVKVTTRNFGVFAVAGLAQILLGFCVGALHHRTVVGGIVGLGLYVASLAGLWLVISLRVAHGDAVWTELLPGAFLYGAGMTGIGIFNVLILGHLIESKSTTYGALGVAATLLLGLFLVGRVMVGSAVLNATLHDRRRRVADV
jgi:uncharacterized BrkB/YihY/UPF0761 family membrane protein